MTFTSSNQMNITLVKGGLKLSMDDYVKSSLTDPPSLLDSTATLNMQARILQFTIKMTVLYIDGIDGIQNTKSTTSLLGLIDSLELLSKSDPSKLYESILILQNLRGALENNISANKVIDTDVLHSAIDDFS